MAINTGQGSIGISPRSISNAGPPFPLNSADNGLSIDPGTGHIVLGNAVGGNAAVLLNSREIPCDTFSIFLSEQATGNLILFRPVSGGQISQVDNVNNRSNLSTPGVFTAADGTAQQQISLETTGAESTIVLDSTVAPAAGIGRISFQTGAVEQFTIRSGDTTTTINGFTIEKTVALAGIKIFPSGRVFIGVTTPNPVDSGAAAQLQIGGALITAAGAPLTVAPAAIRFGGIVAAAAVLDATRYLETVHNGVLVKLAIIV